MHNACMNKHIQIRDVDSQTHALLVQAANRQGLSLNQYLKAELTQLARRLPMRDAIAKSLALPSIKSPVSAVDLIRQDRDGK
jgi:hypothetical protein